MRFLKLELTWFTSPWLIVLSGNARLSWVQLLCYAKASGQAGRVKRLPPHVAARMWFLGEEDVRQMEMAAIADGAITIDGGDWVVSNWSRYQDDEGAKERMRRYRDRLKSGENVTDVTRNERNETCVTIEEKRGEEKRGEEISPPLVPPPGGKKTNPAVELNPHVREPSLEEVTAYGKTRRLPASECAAFLDHHQSLGWIRDKGKKIVNWQAALRTWTKNHVERFGGKLIPLEPPPGKSQVEMMEEYFAIHGRPEMPEPIDQEKIQRMLSGGAK